MKREIYLILFSIVLLGSCTKNSQTTSSEKYKSVADKRFGNGEYVCSENQDMTFTLCLHQLSDKGAVVTSWDFFIYDLEKESVTYSETVERGSVKWINTYEVQVSKVPGTMAEGQTMDDYAWIIDVKTGQKTKKSDYKKQINN